jgi:hypothetical protein
LKTPESGDREPIEFTKALGLLISKDDIEDIIKSAKVWIQEHPYIEPQEVLLYNKYIIRLKNWHIIYCSQRSSE